MNTWNFNDKLSERLLTWAAFSIGGGVALMEENDALQQGVGIQFVGWGAIDGLLALFGFVSTYRNRRKPKGNDADFQAQEARKLRKLLWVNTFLDILYVLAGISIMQTRGKFDRRWRGYGVGVVLQGAFLFFFDWLHARKISV